MKGKDLKQAKVVKVMMDVERPLTFDFNALCELQDHFIDPFIAVSGLVTGDTKCLRALVYASLVAGQLAEDEGDLDITFSQVGRLLGEMMVNNKKGYEDMVLAILAGVTLFLPEKAEKKEDEGKDDSKN